MKRNYYYKKDGTKWVITSVVFVLVFTLLAGLCMQVFAKQDKFKPSTWFSKICIKHEYGEDNKCTKCGKDKPVEKDDEEKPAEDTTSEYVLEFENL